VGFTIVDKSDISCDHSNKAAALKSGRFFLWGIF
jgi:hypothetical protein